MRPIDAEVFEELFNRQMELGATDIFAAVKDALQDTPTIYDMRPVVHARWAVQDETFTRYQCSACKSKNHSGGWAYCPCCGARMDGENDA